MTSNNSRIPSKVWKSFIRADLRNIFRDKMQTMMFFYPFVMWAIVKYLVDKFFIGVPNMQPYLPMMFGFVIVLSPLLTAFIISFIFLEEKDEKILEAISVMPIGPRVFMNYRLLLGFVYTFIISAATPLVLNFIVLEWYEILVISGMSALMSPIMILIVTKFAPNKVEGLVYFKTVGLLLMLPLIQGLITSNWVYLMGLLFSYWPFKVLFQIVLGQSIWGYVIGGILVEFAYLVILSKIRMK